MGTNNFHSCRGLCLNGLTLCTGECLRLQDLLLSDFQIHIGVLLFQPYKVRVIVRSHDRCHEKFRHKQAVFCQRFIDDSPQAFRDAIDMLIHFQNVDVLFLDDSGEVALYPVHDQRLELCYRGLETVRSVYHIAPAEFRGSPHQLEQQLSGIADTETELTAGTQFHMETCRRIEHPHLGISSPFDAHLRGQIDKVHLRMENGICIDRQLIQIFQQGQVLGRQGISSGTKEIQSLAITEKDSFLGFMHDQLRTQVEIFNGVFPDESLVVALILNDAGEPLILDLFLCHLCLDIDHCFAERTGVMLCIFVCGEIAGTGRTGEFHLVENAVAGVDLFLTHRAKCLFALGLVKNDVVSAVRANTGSHFIRFHMNGISTGAVDLFPGKKIGRCFGIFAAGRAFDYKFRHSDTSSKLFIILSVFLLTIVTDLVFQIHFNLTGIVAF